MEMPFSNINMKFAMPFFSGVLLSLFFCVLIGSSYNIFSITIPVFVIENETAEVHEEEYEEFIFSSFEKIPDIILEYYSDPEYRHWVTGFFTNICSSEEIAQAILDNAEAFNVPPALAFALSWEESRFDPNAVNRSNRDGSVDRGLFQLNSRSFPEIDTNGFFKIETNAYYGVSHLRHCLDSGSSEVSALAMYNAGTTRVRSTGAPEVTLNYISRILENRSKIETYFHSRLIREEERRFINITQLTNSNKIEDEAEENFLLSFFSTRR